jgi:hypothetical protein
MIVQYVKGGKRPSISQNKKGMRVYQLITQTVQGKSVASYVIMNRSGKHVATFQVAHLMRSGSPRMRIDVFENGSLSFQVSTVSEQYPYSRALSGFKLADVALYGSGVTIGRDNEALKPYETVTYIPGLDRLKAAGYQIIKAI